MKQWITREAMVHGSLSAPRTGETDRFSPQVFPMSDGPATLGKPISRQGFHRTYHYASSKEKNYDCRGWLR